MTELSDCKLALLHKEAVVQFILRSPLLLASVVPTDYAEVLRTPINSAEIEDGLNFDPIPRLPHRLSSISSSSDLSFRNSVKDSDSDGGGADFGGRLEEGEKKLGSALLWECPTCTFDEMLELTRTQRENEETHFRNDVMMNNEKKGGDRRIFTPGDSNKAVTLMI